MIIGFSNLILIGHISLIQKQAPIILEKVLITQTIGKLLVLKMSKRRRKDPANMHFIDGTKCDNCGYFNQKCNAVA